MTEKRWLALILTLYLLLGIVYAVTTPAFEASDELWHYPMVRHLADGNPLPVQVFDPALAGPWKQEASQPPLYYYLGAALTFWIDADDMDEVRQENPHVDNGLITADGNTNLVVHNPQADPWQGSLLALRLVRLLSVAMGALTVYLTYRIASAALPSRSEIALGAAAVNAFLPMFLFISGSVNNDNLAIMLASLALLMMIEIVAAAAKPLGHTAAHTIYNPILRWLLLGLVIASALLTKEGTIGLLPLAWGTCFVVAWLLSARADGCLGAESFVRGFFAILIRSLVSFLVVLLPVLLVSGWWYLRNLRLYGDILGWNAFVAVLGQRSHPASLAQLWGERRGFMMAYWGLFGGVNIPMPDWIYAMFNTLLLLAVAGFVLFAIKFGKAWLRAKTPSWRSLEDIFNNLMRFIVDHYALVSSFLLAAAVVLGLVRWATTTWSSQGRLVFTALSALSVLFVTGLAGWMPRTAARGMVVVVSLLFLGTATAAPFLWIEPAYKVSAYDLGQEATFEPLSVTPGEKIRVHGTAIELPQDSDGSLRPGDAFWVHLDWEVLSPMDNDWSMFVHAVDPVLGRPIAQRDMYPGQGLLLTSWLKPGQRMVSSFRLHLPATAVAPAELKILTGFYDVVGGERLATGSEDDAIFLDTISLRPLAGDHPNPTRVNFEGLLELQGFAIEPRAARPGDELNLTLYWRVLRPIDESYTFFAQIVGEDTTRWASVDFRPPDGTMNWQPGQVVTMPLMLRLADGTPAEVYPLIIGVYTMNNQGVFDRLQIKTADGRLADDFLTISEVRVEP